MSRVLVCGSGSVAEVAGGVTDAAHLELLGALLVAAAVSTPWVTAQALRISME